MRSTRKKGKEAAEARLQVRNPVAIRSFKPLPAARRPKDLGEKEIGLYWNTKARGDVALERVKELLSERFPGARFRWFETGPVNEATEEWFESVRQSKVHAVVAATGD